MLYPTEQVKDGEKTPKLISKIFLGRMGARRRHWTVAWQSAGKGVAEKGKTFGQGTKTTEEKEEGHSGRKGGK